MKKTILSSLNTIDGETLMSRPLQPLSFVVDTLISQGLHILAGSPKVGKSWLALWLAVTVAKGEPVWGMQVKQGTRTAGSPSSPAWSRRATRSSGQTPGSTSPSSVQTDGSAGTGVSMMRHFSKRTWRHCLFTGRPWASVPAAWGRTKAGWVRWQTVSFSWADRWNGWMIYRRFPPRPPGQTANNAAGRH